MARLRIRFSDWKAGESETIEFGTDASTASPAAKDYAEGLRLYEKGMYAIERGDATGAFEQSKTLDAMLWRLEASKPKAKDQDADEDEEKTEAADDDGLTAVLNLLGTLSLDLRANIKSVQGGDAEALQLFQKALENEKDLGYSEPPQFFPPRTGKYWRRLPRDASVGQGPREAFEQELKQRPKSGYALYGIARSYALAGDVPKAAQAYQDFLASWQNADSDLPQINQANPGSRATSSRARSL